MTAMGTKSVPGTDHCGAVGTHPVEFDEKLIRWFDSHATHAESSRGPTGSLTRRDWNGKQKSRSLDDLLLQQAAMAGHAQPLTVLKHPGIGKSPEMLIWLAAVGAFRMIIPRHDGRG
jgi:hypothetical protein